MADDFLFYGDTSYTNPSYNAANFSFYVTPVAAFVSSSTVSLVARAYHDGVISPAGVGEAVFQNADATISFVGVGAAAFITSDAAPVFAGASTVSLGATGVASGEYSSDGVSEVTFDIYYDASFVSSSTPAFAITRILNTKGLFWPYANALFKGTYEAQARGIFSGATTANVVSTSTGDGIGTFSSVASASFVGQYVLGASASSSGAASINFALTGIYDSELHSGGTSELSGWPWPANDAVATSAGQGVSAFVGGYSSETLVVLPDDYDMVYVTTRSNSVQVFAN